MLQGPLTVYTTTTEYPDLIANNKHLLNNEVTFPILISVAYKSICDNIRVMIKVISGNF